MVLIRDIREISIYIREANMRKINILIIFAATHINSLNS
jgi:hypothetical protein